MKRSAAVERYLDELKKATKQLPPQRRQRLIDDIEAHLAEAVTEHSNDAQIQDTLQRLGPPAAIAAQVKGADPRKRARERYLRNLLLYNALLVTGTFLLINWVAGPAPAIVMSVFVLLAFSIRITIEYRRRLEGAERERRIEALERGR